MLSTADKINRSSIATTDVSKTFFGNNSFFKPSVGNFAVQPKLTVSSANDPLEAEADKIADHVMKSSSAVQRKCAGCEGEEKIDRKEGTPEISSYTGTAASEVAPSTALAIQSSQGSGERMEPQTEDFMSHHFGTSFDDVKIHTNGEAAELNQQLNARAFTTGKDIYFNQGQYQPNSAEGRRLLAHELTHVVQQQDGNSSVQRDDVINMPEERVTVGMPSDLSSLSTPASAGTMTMTQDPAHVELNSQLPSTLLPFNPGGWNGNDIASKLGQYDRIPGTDSDAVRCVQAVALMSHILMGPSAAITYLSSIATQGMLQAGGIGPRQRTALDVISFVTRQIQGRTATYGNMYWAMEAVHDLFYTDNQGTPAANASTVREQITPMMDLSQTMVNMDVWCNTPGEFMTQANTLNPGEQFMLNTWSVSFNYYFDEAGADRSQQRLTYTQTDERDRPIRTVSIRRIDASRKPRGNQIDTNRDHRSGHQMLVYKDAVDNHIKIYEPELTTTGNHLTDLTNDASVLDNILFFDQPAFEMYKYVQLWGKMVPAPASSVFTAP